MFDHDELLRRVDALAKELAKRVPNLTRDCRNAGNWSSYQNIHTELPDVAAYDLFTIANRIETSDERLPLSWWQQMHVLAQAMELTPHEHIERRLEGIVEPYEPITITGGELWANSHYSSMAPLGKHAVCRQGIADGLSRLQLMGMLRAVFHCSLVEACEIEAAVLDSDKPTDSTRR